MTQSMIRKTAAALATLLVAGTAAATGTGTPAVHPLDVGYTVTGSTGDWTLDFSVANNMVGTSQDVYFFGVSLDAAGVTGSPAGYNSSAWSNWSNAYYGGSSTNYNNNWIDFSFSHAGVGSTVDGFTVHSADAVAPTSVDWFAYGLGSSYTGGGNFSNDGNPGFEGVATAAPSAVPEPANLAFLLAGLGVVGFGASRRRISR